MATTTERVEDPKNISDLLRKNTQFIIQPGAALMARVGIKPNTLTLFGLLIHLPVALLLAQGRWTPAAFIALLGFVDAFDGALARRLGLAGENKFGAFFDSTIDRISEILLFGGFVYYYASQSDPFFATISLIALGGSLMVSYTRARAEGLGIYCEVGIFSRIVRYGIFFFITVIGYPEISLIILAAGTWITTGQRMHHVHHAAAFLASDGD